VLIENSRRLVGQGKLVRTAKSPEKQRVVRDAVAFKISGHSMLEHGLSREINEIKTEGEHIVAVNGRYGFMIQRASANGEWSVARVDEDTQHMDEALFEGVLEYVEAPWVLVGKPLPVLISDDQFKLNDVAAVERDNEKLVKFTFTYDPPNPRDTAMRSGSIVVDPSRHWAIREYQLDVIWGKMEGSVEYGESVDGVPVIRRVVSHSAGQDGTSTVDEQFEFEKYEFRDLPAGEFQLAAFHLPEPQLAKNDSPAQNAKVHIVEAKKSFGRSKANVKQTLRFAIQNDTEHSIRIVGAEDRCSAEGCTATKGLPVTVLAGKTVEVDVEFAAVKSGKVSLKHTLFCDHPGKRKLVVTIEGQIVDELSSGP
jgi:hypothetical protein